MVEERKDRDAIHDGGFEEKALATSGGEIAKVAVGVDDRSFIGGDGVGSVLEGGADVIDGGLAVFDIQGRGFEEDVGAGGFQPVCGRWLASDSIRGCLAGEGARSTHSGMSRPSGLAIHPRRRVAIPVMRKEIP